jgi:hypothetical protein
MTGAIELDETYRPAGAPEKTAILPAGHKSGPVFDRYDIVNEADLRQAVEKLALAGLSCPIEGPGQRGKNRRNSLLHSGNSAGYYHDGR